MKMPRYVPQDSLRGRMQKRRVYQEESKTRQTSHWDWDYLPMATLERLARAKPPAAPDLPSVPERGGRLKTALACIVAGALLLAAFLAFVLVDLRSV